MTQKTNFPWVNTKGTIIASYTFVGKRIILYIYLDFVCKSVGVSIKDFKKSVSFAQSNGSQFQLTPSNPCKWHEKEMTT